MDFLQAVDKLADLMEWYRDEQTGGADRLTKRESLILSLLESGDLGIMQIVERVNTHCNTSEATISYTLKRLFASKRYVKKYIDPQNQRITMVRLTKRGRDALGEERQHRKERFVALRAALDLKPDEEKFVVRLLSRAMKRFDQLTTTDVMS